MDVIINTGFNVNVTTKVNNVVVNPFPELNISATPTANPIYIETTNNSLPTSSGTISGNFSFSGVGGTRVYNIDNVIYISGGAGTGSNGTSDYYPLNSNPSGYLTNSDLTGINLTGLDFSSYVTKDQTGQFYSSNNPSGYITGIDLTPYINSGQASQFYPRTENPSGFITTGQTGIFYTINNPSGFITFAQITGTTFDGELIFIGAGTTTVYTSGESIIISGDSSSIDTGLFYPSNSNPSGYITGIDTSLYVTTDQTGRFYSSSNPNGFITGINLSSYITTGQTGEFASLISLSATGINIQDQLNTLSGYTVQTYVNKTDTGIFYLSSNPSGYLTSKNLTGYITSGNLTGYVLNSDTGNFLTTNIADYLYLSITSGSMPATGVISELVYDLIPSIGVSLRYARADHTHGTPSASVGGLTRSQMIAGIISFGL